MYTEKYILKKFERKLSWYRLLIKNETIHTVKFK